MSEWIQVKSDKKKKAPAAGGGEDARASAPVAGGMASERAAFWGETTKKAAAKLEAYDRDQGRHGDGILKDTEPTVSKTTGIPNAEAIGGGMWGHRCTPTPTAAPRHEHRGHRRGRG